MNTKKLTIPLVALALVLSAGGGIAAAAHADTSTTGTTTNIAGMHTGGQHHKGEKGGPGRGQGIHGTVTAVNGTTLTVTGSDGKTYTVDASTGEVTKIQTITVAGIAVGDTVGVRGAVTGTSVVAKHIMDGPLPPGRPHGK